MSVDLQVVFDPTRMPTTTQWATAVHAAGFEVHLDTDFDPESFSGFLPCQYKNEVAGFEYYRGTLSSSEQANLGVPDAQSCYITFSTRSDYREFATSMVCAAVLAAQTGGRLFDADGTTAIPTGSEIDWAREGVQSIQAGIQRQGTAASSLQAPSQSSPTPRPWWRFW